MRIEELGYRRPSVGDLVRTLARHRRGKIPPAPGATRTGFAVPLAILHGEPLVAYSGIVPEAPLGLASVLGRREAPRRAWFLLSPTWSLENASLVRRMRKLAVLHRWRHPGHRLVFLCNTAAEARLLQDAGEAAIVHNKTTHVSEQVFRPLDGVTREFDAVYNAQLLPWKRHELALEIPRCAFVFYRGLHRGASTSASEQAFIRGHLRQAPRHVFLNDFDAEGRPVRLEAEAVNAQLARAAVGLCLSAEEGAMFACVEYLLAGLAVVTTPSRGGRGLFVDGWSCLEVPADAGAVAEATAALRERRLPPAEVREAALRRIAPHRACFADLVGGIYARARIAAPPPGIGPARRPAVMAWMPVDEARRRVRERLVDDV